MKKAKPVLVLALKLVVSVGLLAYFLARIHIERFLQTFANAKFSYIALVMLVYLFTQGISAARWTTLARPLGIKTPFPAMLRYYLIGMFFNLFAPGTVGGDVSRVYYLVKDEDARAKGHAVTTVHAAMSVLMDRAIGMVVLVWLGALGLWLFPYYAVPHAARVATFLLALGFLAVGLLLPVLRRVLPQDGHPLVVKRLQLTRCHDAVKRASRRRLRREQRQPAHEQDDEGHGLRMDKTRSQFKRAVFFRRHRLSAGRDLFRDPHQFERSWLARRRLYLSFGGYRHQL